MKAIPSRFNGTCRIGEHDIKRGEYIVRHEESGTWVHEDCALNDDGFTHVEPRETDGADFDSFNRGRTPGIVVLPRGKTGKDKCTSCFMVHSPGQDGCE
jgi:hypothetical protein